MTTIIRKINRSFIDKKTIEEAGNILRQGGLVAFPTETVYGLGAHALKKEAAKKIYKAKGRPSDNPLIIHIAKYDDLRKIVKEVSLKAESLAREFWPGPLTMIFKKEDIVPLETTGGLSTVAVRMPDDEIALALIESGGGYVAAPSANASGRPSPTLAEHVREDLEGKIEMILDGGPVFIGLESTIIDMTGETPMILRPGYITKEMIENTIGKVEEDETLMTGLASNVKPKAPGMKYRHYAPKGELTIVEGPIENVIKEINQMVDRKIKKGLKVGIIGTDETKLLYSQGNVKSIGSRKNEESIARHLYQILREFDELDVSCIYTEAFDTPKMGQAIMNRLLKAAGHHVVHV